MENYYQRKDMKKFLSSQDNPNVHLHMLDKLPFRMVVVAPSGSGKTNFIMNLLQKFSSGKGTFNTITVITRNKDEPLYNYLEEKTKKQVKILEGVQNIPKLDSFNKDDQHIVIFDDLVLEKDQTKMNEFYIRGRKRGISMVYLSQSFFKIPKVIRTNCNYFVILKLSGKRDLNLIMSEFELGITKKDLLRMYEFATKEKFSVLLIDVEAPKEERFRKNFLEFLDT
jgi:DNA helicase HerA-like ATPase